jgi:hypothetical protein
MYRMVLYPVHRLIFKIVFKKVGRAVLHAGLLFPSPNQVPPRFRRGRIGDTGRCSRPKIIVGATETRASRLYGIGC